MTITPRGLKVKVMGQANAVGLTSIEGIFLVLRTINTLHACVVLQRDSNQHHVSAAAAASGCQSDDVSHDVTRRRLSYHPFMDG